MREKLREAELGSVVRIRSSRGDRSVLLVEPDEADPFTNRVSVESPLGSALIHGHKYDLVNVHGSRQDHVYIIKDVMPKSLREKYAEHPINHYYDMEIR